MVVREHRPVDIGVKLDLVRDFTGETALHAQVLSKRQLGAACQRIGDRGSQRTDGRRRDAVFCQVVFAEPEVLENRAIRVERLSSQTVRQPCSSAEDVPAIGLCDDLGEAESSVAVLNLQEVPRRRPPDVDLAVMEPCGPKPKVAHVWLLLIHSGAVGGTARTCRTRRTR